MGKKEDFVEQISQEEQLAVQRDVRVDIVEGMDDISAMYCSFTGETFEDKRRLLNASTGTGESVLENVNKPIAMIDVIVMPVAITNEETKQVDICPRCCILTPDDTVYTATSWGLYRALQRVNAVFGTLHFSADNPLMVEFNRVKTKKGQTINLKLL